MLLIRLFHKIRNFLAERLFGEERTETCDRCGKRFAEVWHAPDDIWLRANNGSPYGSFCIDCLIYIVDSLEPYRVLYWSCKFDNYPELENLFKVKG